MGVLDDPDHSRASDAFRQCLACGARPITTRFVVAETITRLRYDVSHGGAVAVAEAINEMEATGLLEVIAVDDTTWRAALGWFKQYSDQRFSFVDCVSFAVMRARGIDEVLTCDRHFAAAGFVPISG